MQRSWTRRRAPRRDAALARVRKLGDPVLRASAVEVERFDERAAGRDRADGRADGGRARDRPGRHAGGRAAPGAGVPGARRRSDHGAGEPGARVGQARSSKPRRRAVSACPACTSRWSAPRGSARERATRSGAEILVEAEGLHARVIQHEIDHLDGVLILDRISREARKRGDARDARSARRRTRPATRPRRGWPTPTRAPRSRPRARGGRRSSCALSSSAPPRSRRLCSSAWPPSEHRPALVLTRPDRPRGAGAGSAPRRWRRPPAVLQIALEQPADVNEPPARELIARCGPDAVIVCAFGALIREPLLSAHELLNVHPSLLPRWRGAAPVERAIMAGDERRASASCA